MNEHLTKIYKKYKNKLISINPISQIDAEIINEIIIAFDKLNIKELKDIINDYKKKKDEEIRDKLLDWNINFIKKESNKIFKKFISFGEKDKYNIDIYKLKAILKEEEYNPILKKQNYLLIVKTSDIEEDNYYTLVFDKEKLRDKELENIKNKLIGYDIKFV